MKKHQVKFQPRQQAHEELENAQTTQSEQRAREFASAEEMLRCDAEQTEVPPAVEERLAETIRQESPPPESGGSWWRQIFL